MAMFLKARLIWFELYNFSVRFYIYIACSSVLSLQILKPLKTYVVVKHIFV